MKANGREGIQKDNNLMHVKIGYGTGYKQSERRNSRKTT